MNGSERDTNSNDYKPNTILTKAYGNDKWKQAQKKEKDKNVNMSKG